MFFFLLMDVFGLWGLYKRRIYPGGGRVMCVVDSLCRLDGCMFFFFFFFNFYCCVGMACILRMKILRGFGEDLERIWRRRIWEMVLSG